MGNKVEVQDFDSWKESEESEETIWSIRYCD